MNYSEYNIRISSYSPLADHLFLELFSKLNHLRVRDSSGRQGDSLGEPATGEAATNEATVADGRPKDEPLTTSV